MLARLAQFGQWLYGQAYVLLTMTMLFWAGNFVLGRYVAGHVPPVAFAFARWGGAFLIILPFAWPHLLRDWPEIRRNMPMLILLAFTGITSYNTMVYFGLQFTGALTGVLLQTTLPLIIALATFLLFGERLTIRQAIGILISLTGVAVVICQGDLGRLLSIRFNIGDVVILCAVVLYGLYSALLRKRPSIHWISFLASTFLIGDILLAPLLAWEISTDYVMTFDALTVAACVYVAIFPSLFAFAFFNRGIELIGANRTGPFFHLMPMFGALMAIGFLGESFKMFHAVGMAAILGGVALATAAPRKRKNVEADAISS